MTPDQAKKITDILEKGKKGGKKKMEWNGKDSDSHINVPSKKKPEDIPEKK